MNEPHSTSSFASPSDALFASLVNKYKDVVAKELLDDVLALFRHPEFRSERVTLRETDDIFVTVHIADQEQVTARSRLRAVERIGAQSRTGHQFSHHPQMPNLVMELLAEYLDANRVPFATHFGQQNMKTLVVRLSVTLIACLRICRSSIDHGQSWYSNFFEEGFILTKTRFIPNC